MTEDKSKKYFGQFAALARERLDRAQKNLGPPAAPPEEIVVRELHSLGDEAELLGLKDIITFAREAEHAARTSRQDEATMHEWKAKLLVAIGRLEAAIRAAEQPVQTSAKASALREKFRAQFAQSATKRYERAASLLSGAGDQAPLDAVASELHTLGGEAALVGSADIATLSRIAEDAAHRNDRRVLRHALDQLEVAIFAEDVPGAVL